MFEIINTQNAVQIETGDFESFVGKSLALFPETKEKSVSIVFVSDEKMIELNGMFRGKPKTTDVLSFPSDLEEFENPDNTMGEVVISIEQAQKQASENGLKLAVELQQLIVHGILHLSGYDHETDSGEMNSLELELRDKLGINN